MAMTAEYARLRLEAIPQAFGTTTVVKMGNERVTQFEPNNDALIAVRGLASEFATEADNSNIYGVWDQLCGFAGAFGAECGQRLACEMWFAISEAQSKTGKWIHKGLPLFRMWGMYREMGRDWERRWFALLTLIEDSLRDYKNGSFPATNSSAYFRAQAELGLDRSELNLFAQTVIDLDTGNKGAGTWAEEILEGILRELPQFRSILDAGLVTSSSSVPFASKAAVQWIRESRAKVKDGKTFELIAAMVFGAIPGSRCRRDVKAVHQIDVLVDIVGNQALRARFGNLIVVECKDWERRADITVASKLLAAMNVAGAQTGVIFSKQGATGKNGKPDGATKFAIASFLKLGLNILVIDESDLGKIVNGHSFTDMLIGKQLENQILAEKPRREPRGSS